MNFRVVIIRFISNLSPQNEFKVAIRLSSELLGAPGASWAGVWPLGAPGLDSGLLEVLVSLGSDGSGVTRAPAPERGIM